MIDLEQIIRQMTSNAKTIRALVEAIPNEQANWKPDPETWSLKEVMEHVYNEERIDFRLHLKEILHDPPQPWEAFLPEKYLVTENCHQALDGFLMEREASTAWLQELKSPDWQVTTQASFGPSDDVLVLSAADVLFSWVAHDFLHIRQMNELMYAWNANKASPHSVEYAGGW